MTKVDSGEADEGRLGTAPGAAVRKPADPGRLRVRTDHAGDLRTAPAATLRDATPAELAGWDAATVESPGGHVFQSRAWAAHCATGGWRPRFIASDDGIRILALERRWPLVPGGSAYICRGPVAGGTGAMEGGDQPGNPAARAARALIAASDALAEWGADVVAADPEIPAGQTEYAGTIRSAGFRAIEELQPSRHRISLPLPPGSVDEAVFGAISKSTRQRIRAAERDLQVVRFDRRSGPSPDGVAAADEPLEPALARFATLLQATGERRGFRFDRADFIAWWRAAHAAGHLVLLEARDADAPVGGLLLYRHGGRLSTAHSADRAADRRRYPGALHLLRWRAAQLALREGCVELDLGGVDVAGARRPPVEGEPMYGLYQHKLSFGGRWLELAGAHERVVRPTRYAAGRVTSRVLRTVRPVRDPGAG